MLSSHDLRSEIEQADRAWGLQSLYYLAKNILGYELLEPTPHMDVCAFAESVERDHFGMDLEPRGSFKTTQISQALPIKLLLNNPNLRILLDSSVLQNSIDNLRVIKQHFEGNEYLRYLYGDYVGDYWVTEEMTVKKRTNVKLKEPSIRCASAERVQVGPHYDWIIVDDLVSDLNSRTPEGRAQIVQHFRLLMSLLDPGGNLIVVGTRWHFEDLYGYILQELPEFKSRIKHAAKLLSDGKIDESTLYFPQRLNKAFLDQTLKIQGRDIFSCQYLNDPAPEDENAKFQRAWFKRLDKIPENRNSYVTIDPGGEKKGSDEWVMMLTHVDENSNKYFDKLLRGHWKMRAAWDFLFDLVLNNDVSVVGLETTGGQKWLHESLMDEMRRRNKFFTVQPLTHAGDSKEYRILRLQPHYQAGAIYHSAEMAPLEEQLLRFPRGKDDVADCASMALEICMSPHRIKAAQHKPKTTDEYFLHQFRQQQRQVRGHSVLGSNW